MGNREALEIHVDKATADTLHTPTNWHDEFNECETTYDVFRALRRFAGQYGFQLFIVLNEPDRADAALAEISIINNWNPEIFRAYDHIHLMDGSPVVHWLNESAEPLFWSIEEMIGNSGDQPDREAIELLKNAGHLSGVFFPVFSADSRKGAVGFSGFRTRPLSDRQMMEMAWACGVAYNKLRLFDQPSRAQKAVLTDREVECINWIAAGKSSAETATILGISPHTVDHYLATAGHKLDTVNRAHTVATALRLRLLK